MRRVWDVSYKTHHLSHTRTCLKKCTQDPPQNPFNVPKLASYEAGPLQVWVKPWLIDILVQPSSPLLWMETGVARWSQWSEVYSLSQGASLTMNCTRRSSWRMIRKNPGVSIEGDDWWSKHRNRCNATARDTHNIGRWRWGTSCRACVKKMVDDTANMWCFHEYICRNTYGSLLGTSQDLWKRKNHIQQGPQLHIIIQGDSLKSKDIINDSERTLIFREVFDLRLSWALGYLVKRRDFGNW